MRTIFQLILLPLQCIITFFALLTCYMIFALFDYQGGLDGFISTTFVQPVMGSIIAILTIIICLLFGLPIRLIKKINIWWSEKYFLPIMGVFIGVVLLVLSIFPAFQEHVQVDIDGELVTREIPNTAFALSGWFTTAFFLLHIFPPEKLKQWLRSQGIKLKLH